MACLNPHHTNHTNQAAGGLEAAECPICLTEPPEDPVVTPWYAIHIMQMYTRLMYDVDS